jgi:tetratricopeptide (TPR) repeat protein
MAMTAQDELGDAEAKLGAAATDGAKLSALLVLARKLSRVGDPKRAIELGLRALDLAQTHNNAIARAQAVEVVADAQLATCAYADALARHLEALSLWRALANVHGQVRCLRGIATVDLYVGDYARALGRFEEALVLLRTQHDVALEAAVFTAWAWSTRGSANSPRRENSTNSRCAAARCWTTRPGSPQSLNSLGVLCLRVGEQRRAAVPKSMAVEFHRAQVYFGEAEQLAARVGDLQLQALALGNIGSAVAFLGDSSRRWSCSSGSSTRSTRWGSPQRSALPREHRRSAAPVRKAGSGD